MTIKIGLVGAGRWGKRYIDTIEKLYPAKTQTEVELAFVCTRNPLIGDVWVGHQHHWYNSLEQALKEHDVQGVIIASPPQSHVALASLTIERGIPTLIEKPVALSASQTRDLYMKSIQHSCPVMVGHVHLYSDAYRALKLVCEDQTKFAVGVDTIKSIGRNDGPDRDFSPLWDWAPHDLSMILDLLPGSMWKVDRVARTMQYTRSIWNFELISNRALQPIRVECGNLSANKIRRIKVFSGNYEFVYDDLLEKKVWSIEKEQGTTYQWSVPFVTRGTPLENMVKAFAIRCEKKAMTNAENPAPMNYDLFLACQIATIIEDVNKQTLDWWP